LAEIRPFPGVRYRVPDSELPRVLAPPYDVIPPPYQEALYARDPRNIVRVILNRGTGDAAYDEAGATYRRWLADGVLAPDPEPSLYLLEQSFTVEDRHLARVGLLARVRAEDPGTRKILPHEQTRKGPREDRWRVLLATRANFSPILMMFPDARGTFASLAATAMTSRPESTFADDGGVAHRLWRIADPAAIAAFADALARPKAYIADGHHRYATALRYRDEHGPEGAWTLGYFTPLEAPGLVVLPYHRILAQGPSLTKARRALEGRFRLSTTSDTREAARETGASAASYAFGLAEPGAGGLMAEALPAAEELLPRDAPPSLRALDTYFLHQAVLPKLLEVADSAVRYVHSLAEAEETLAAGACRLAVLLRATPPQQIVDVAEAGESMPAKSTFFHPKLPSGLVIHPLASG
jgi:uncharacterized protein (DUF1015 family)